MNCEFLRNLSGMHDECEITDRGIRFKTHCFYPSLERVAVYVSKHGEGFRVTDGGEAAASAFRHGRDDYAFEASLKRVCSRYGLEPLEGALVAEVPDNDWLFSAILAVANGAAQAAHETSDKVIKRKAKELRTKIHAALIDVVPPHKLATEFTYRGKSGRLWKIDFAVPEERAPLLVKAITPDINSVNSNYTTYDDIYEAERNHARRFSVFDRQLGNEERALMLRVAELVPLESLSGGTRTALNLQ